MTSILIWPTLAWSSLTIPIFLGLWLVWLAIGFFCAAVAALIVGGIARIYALTNGRKVESPLMHFGGLVLAGFFGQGIGTILGAGALILYPNVGDFVFFIICALGVLLPQILYLAFVWPNLEKK